MPDSKDIICPEFEMRLAELISGSSSDDERTRLERHAGCCSHCARLYETALGRIPTAVPGGLVDHILSATSGASCGRVRDSLCSYVDGELSEQEGALVEAHLDHCVPCAALSRSLQSVSRVLPELAESDPGEDFATEVLRRTLWAPRASPSLFEADWLKGWIDTLASRPMFALQTAYLGSLLLFGLLGLAGAWFGPVKQEAVTKATAAARNARMLVSEEISNRAVETRAYLDSWRDSVDSEWNRTSEWIVQVSTESLDTIQGKAETTIEEGLRLIKGLHTSLSNRSGLPERNSDS